MEGSSLKYHPKLATTLVFLVLLGGCMFLFQGRKYPELRLPGLEAALPGYHTHISNFVISYVLFVGIGYLWLMLGVRLGKVVALGATILAINWIYELFIPVLNVPDVADAWYGTAGAGLGLVVLWLIDRHGLRPAVAA